MTGPNAGHSETHVSAGGPNRLDGPSERPDEKDAEKLRGKLLSLASIEQDIRRQRFGLDGATPCTLTEIGHQYDLSRERIGQLQQRALETLRRTIESSAA